MKKILLVLVIGFVGCGSERPSPSPDVAPAPVTHSTSTKPIAPVASAPRPQPAPQNQPEVKVEASQDTPVVTNKTTVGTPKNVASPEPQPTSPQDMNTTVAPAQISFIRLAENEVQLELQDCNDYSLVVVSPGHLIVASTTAEGEPICFLINTQLIPGLKGRDLNLKDTIRIGDFDFVIVARG